MEIKSAAVIGGGTMGNGIATVLALSGFSTTLVEISETQWEKSFNAARSNLERMLKKGSVTQQQFEDAQNRLGKSIGIQGIPAECDIVIEAVNENLELKKKIFNELHSFMRPEVLFASNTSSISITELAAGCRPERFIGMHFMNPVPVMKLVEIIRGYSTSEETFLATKQLTEMLGKVPVEVQDYPGFVANRILMPMINEAVFTLMEGVATAESIDTVMKLGMNHPMGPLTLADFIGLDVCLAILNVMFDGFKDTKYRPCPLLVKMVAANKLGRKTGEGFYKYQ